MEQTPQEALNLLDSAVAQMNVNREGHAQLLAAVKSLQDLIDRNKKNA